jgi:NodT family efflux transporter outer membrane factor (OMF) lipoprotein
MSRFFSRNSIIVIVAGAVFFSCVHPARQVREPVQAPDRFSRSGDDLLPAEWWQHFEDPRLSLLMEHALESNFSLKTAWDRLAQAEARLKAAGADLYPSLDLVSGLSYRRRRQEDSSGDFSTSDSTNRSLGLDADYVVDLWGRVRSGQEAEALDVLSASENLHTAALSLTSRIALAWYQLEEQQGQLNLLERQIETSETTLKAIENRFRLGQSSASDVLQQRQLTEARREDRQRVISSIETLKIALSILLGQAPGSIEILPDGRLVDLPPLPATGIPAEVVARRPDVRLAYYGVLAADRRVAAAIANKYPTLRLSAGLSTDADDWRDLFDNWLATLAANLVAPLFDGGARQAEVIRTEAVVMERFHDYGQTILEALGEVEQALVEERQQGVALESLENQLALARQVLVRVRENYLQGQENYLRVLDAQQSVQSLERQVLTARGQLINFRIDLCRAMAGGWELELPAMEQPFIGETDSDLYSMENNGVEKD